MMSACGIQTSCRSLISAAISPSPKLRCRRRGAITALHSGLSQIGDPCGAVCLLWPRRTKRKYRFDCCVVDWVLIRICRISIDHVKYISSTYAERLSGLYSALSRLFRHIVLLCSFERPAVAVQANSSAQFCAGKTVMLAREGTIL